MKRSNKQDQNMDRMRLALSTERCKDEICIPVSFFKKYRNINPGQVLALYLCDEMGMGWTEAGRLVGRSDSTIRKSYAIAKEKQSEQTSQTHNDTTGDDPTWYEKETQQPPTTM